MRTKLRQTIYRIKKNYLTLDNIILVVALVLCASWAWASITTMSRNWELEQKLAAKQLAKSKLELEIETMELEQEYYLSAEYQELMARAKHGKMLDGETMVILPKNSSAAKEKYTTETTVATVQDSNFQSWLKFLFP